MDKDIRSYFKRPAEASSTPADLSFDASANESVFDMDAASTDGNVSDTEPPLSSNANASGCTSGNTDTDTSKSKSYRRMKKPEYLDVYGVANVQETAVCVCITSASRHLVL